MFNSCIVFDSAVVGCGDFGGSTCFVGMVGAVTSGRSINVAVRDGSVSGARLNVASITARGAVLIIFMVVVPVTVLITNFIF